MRIGIGSVEWPQEQLGLVFYAPWSAFDVFRGLERTGSVVFTDYTGENVEITLVGRDALTRRALRFWAQYIFDEGDMLPLMERLGFKAEGIIRRNYPGGDDAILFGMLKGRMPLD